jgi:ribosome biogenesis GTPase A
MEFVRMTIQRAGTKGLAAILTIDPDGPLPPDADPLAWLSAFARRRGLLGVGAEPNQAQAAQALVSDFRRGRLGRITLEVPADTPSANDPV